LIPESGNRSQQKKEDFNYFGLERLLDLQSTSEARKQVRPNEKGQKRVNAFYWHLNYAGRKDIESGLRML
jgi:hypothetical protein